MTERENPEATSDEEIDDLEVAESDADDVKGGVSFRGGTGKASTQDISF